MLLELDIVMNIRVPQLVYIYIYIVFVYFEWEDQKCSRTQTICTLFKLFDFPADLGG